jgi:hypothetical protein
VMAGRIVDVHVQVWLNEPHSAGGDVEPKQFHPLQNPFPRPLQLRVDPTKAVSVDGILCSSA